MDLNFMQIFKGSDIQVSLQEQEASDILFVTFNSWHRHMHPTQSRKVQPFGKGVLYSIGFNQISVETNKNNWFQTEEIFKAIERINTFAQQRCKKVITYGSSMGGFASINFASHLNADFFVTISPQYSINPLKMHKDDTRWNFEFKHLDYRYDFIDEGLSKDVPGVVFYDHKSLDTHHADSIQKKTRAVLIAVPHSGHPSGNFINRMFGLKRMLREVASGTFTPETFTHEITEKLPSTVEYMLAYVDQGDNRNLLKQKITSSTLSVDELILILRSCLKLADHELCEITLKASYLRDFQATGKYDVFMEQKAQALLMLGQYEEAFGTALKIHDVKPYLAKKVLCSMGNPKDVLALLEAPSLSADVLRDVALSYEKKDVAVALELMSRAAKKRPDGPFIQQKLKEYDEAVNGAPQEEDVKMPLWSVLKERVAKVWQ